MVANATRGIGNTRALAAVTWPSLEEVADLKWAGSDGRRHLGRFLVEMAVLERAVDRALLDQYSNDDTRDLFIAHFLERKTLGPKCDALIAVAINAGEGLERTAAEELCRQIRELFRVRNDVAHESPTFECQIEHHEPLWGNDYVGYELAKFAPSPGTGRSTWTLRISSLWLTWRLTSEGSLEPTFIGR